MPIVNSWHIWLLHGAHVSSIWMSYGTCEGVMSAFEWIMSQFEWVSSTIGMLIVESPAIGRDFVAGVCHTDIPRHTCNIDAHTTLLHAYLTLFVAIWLTLLHDSSCFYMTYITTRPNQSRHVHYYLLLTTATLLHDPPSHDMCITTDMHKHTSLLTFSLPLTTDECYITTRPTQLRHVWYHAFTCVAWLNLMCDTTHSHVGYHSPSHHGHTGWCVWHDSIICVTQLPDACDTTHSYLRHHALIFMTPKLISVTPSYADMAHVRVWHHFIGLFCKRDLHSLQNRPALISVKPLVYSDDGTVKIWDIITGHCDSTLDRHLST